jgi:hypothetical protein
VANAVFQPIGDRLRPLYAELDFALVVTRSVPVRVAENIDGAYRRAGRMVARGDGLCEPRKLRLLSWWKRRYRVLIASRNSANRAA